MLKKPTSLIHSEGTTASYQAIKGLIWVFCSFLLLPTVKAAEASTMLDIQNSNVSAQIESVDVQQSEQDRLKKLIEAKPAAYQDKVMSAPELFELTTEEAESLVNTNFQSYFIETRAGYDESQANTGNKGKVSNQGVRFEYLYETNDFGDLRVQGQSSQEAKRLVNDSLSVENDAKDSSITISNNNLSLTTKIAADSALGDISSELASGLGRSSYLSLGVDSVRGARTRIRSNSFDVRFGSGDLGELRGSPYGGYRKTDGRLSWIGGSYKLNKDFTFGVQVNQADNFELASSANLKVTSTALGVNYTSDSDYAQKLRLTILNSELTDKSLQTTSAKGIAIEGSLQLGRYLNEFGAYQSDPKLFFGKNLISSGRQGVYWNLQREGNRFTFSTSLGLEQNNLAENKQGENSTSLNVDGNFQYHINRDHLYGGNLRIQQSSYDSEQQADRRSVYLYGYYQLFNTDWGRSRFSVSLHRNEQIVSNDVAATGDEFQWEQDWLGNTTKVATDQPELVTTLGLAHDRSGTETTSYPTAGINMRYWPTSDWSLSSSLNYSSQSGKLSTLQGLAGAIASEYRVTQNLLVGATVNLNQAKVETDGQGINLARTMRSKDKSAQFYLRWEGSRGQASGVLGKKTAGSAGTGSIVGFVFLDQNQDGERQVGEVGAPNVEVYLDGGYSVRTDNQGYFEFMRVATGSHELTLNLDTIPLPWSAKEDSLSTEVSLRGQVTANLALTKGAE